MVNAQFTKVPRLCIVESIVRSLVDLQYTASIGKRGCERMYGGVGSVSIRQTPVAGS